MLSKHIAHLFIRDPLVIFSELINQDDTTSMDHFEVSTSRNFFGRTFGIYQLPTTEYTIYQLADRSFQAPACELRYWLTTESNL